MTILVTGGAGYLGAEVVRQLSDKGEQVVIFDVAPRPAWCDHFTSAIEYIRGDLGDFHSVLNAFQNRGIKAVYHYGSMLTLASEQNPWASFNVNVVGI